MKLKGIYTHVGILPQADVVSESVLQALDMRVKKYFDLVCPVVEDLDESVELHWASSYPTIHMRDYGLPASICKNNKNNLKFMVRPGQLTYTGNILTIITSVLSVITFPKGSTVGYTARVTTRDTFIATLPIGYADGYPYGITPDEAKVWIVDNYYPIFTRPTMNMMMVDVTDRFIHENKTLPVGTPVELMGPHISDSTIIEWYIFFFFQKKKEKQEKTDSNLS